MPESKYTIDYLGNKDDNTLTSTTTNKNEIFVAGAGNDTLTGNGGIDVFNAGCRVSIPPPPSTRARLPVPVCSKVVILLALMMISGHLLFCFMLFYFLV
jgi:hypothetical protein